MEQAKIRSRFCSLCGQPLQGEYRMYHHSSGRGQGLAVCTQCEHSAGRCAHCNIPMSANSPDALCVYCIETLPRCSICKRTIVGIGYHQPNSDELICPACTQSAERCSICGRPLGDSVAAGNAHPKCPDCLRTAVTDPVVAQALFEKVMNVIHEQLHLYVHIRPTFSLASRAQLDVLQAQNDTLDNPELAKGHLLGLYAKRARNRQILVEMGLPQLLMTKVMAHEYGHAWQGENCPFLRDPLLIEGFCEWVSYKTLGALGAVKEQKRLLEATGFYADALQMILAVEEMNGFQGVIERIRSPHQEL